MTGVWIESRRRCASETGRGRERVTEAEEKAEKE